MIVPSFIIAMIHFGTASDHRIHRIPRGSYRLPLQFTLAGGDQTIDGFASINVNERHFSFNPSFVHDPQSNTDHIEAQSISFQGTQLALATPIRYYDESSSRTNSDFGMARGVHAVLISPESTSEDICIIDPSNPTDYALEGEIFYSPMMREEDTNTWTVQTVVRFASAHEHWPEDLWSPDFSASSISTSETDDVSVPWALIEEFASRLGPVQMNLHYDENFMTLEGVDEAALEALPSFKISVQAEDGTEVQIGTLEPRDYIVPTEIPNTYHVALATSFMIPRKVIKNLVLHIDYENQRVGFGEPLVELEH